MKRILPVAAALMFAAGGLGLRAAADPAVPAPPPIVNLTPSQQQRLAALHSESHTQSQQLYDQLRQITGQLYQTYGAYDFDVKAAKRLNGAINRIQGQLLDLRLSEQQQLRVILAPDQFAQLQAGMRQHGPWDGDDRHDHDHDHDHGRAPWSGP